MSATDESNSQNQKNDTTVSPSSRLTGRVKWFNNKTGFGFITALTDSEGVKEGSDVFVHHSTIKVAQEQYRYLVQGEYIEFVLSKIADASNKHEYQAADVSGVKGGKLICETRWESRLASGGGVTKPAASGSGAASRFNPTEKPAGSSSGEWKTVEGSRKTSSTFAPRQSGGQWRRGDSSGRGGRGRGASGGSSE